MSKPCQPNVAADMIGIHSVITRGLNVSLERSQAFAQGGFPDDTTREGFADYVESLVSVLHAHHLTDLSRALTKMADLWGPHIHIEEEHFSVEKGAELIDVWEIDLTGF